MVLSQRFFCHVPLVVSPLKAGASWMATARDCACAGENVSNEESCLSPCNCVPEDKESNANKGYAFLNFLRAET